MLAGLYPDIIKKLVLLAPAATLKEDAIKGICMGTKYDTENIPETVLVDGQHEVGGHYFRIAKSLAIYETTCLLSSDDNLLVPVTDVKSSFVTCVLI